MRYEIYGNKNKNYRSTTQFICIGAFHARVSDPIIGGTYMTVCILFTFGLSLASC